MALHSGVPFWQTLPPAAVNYPPLCTDAKCEVCIIGGGISGALAGFLLTKAGVGALLVDKRQPSAGSTAASTGLLQYEIDTHLSDLIAKVGQERAVHAYLRGLRAIDELEAICAELPDDCGFARRPSLYLASGWCDLRSLRREYECRREHGLPVDFLSRRQIAARSSLKSAGGIWSLGDAQVNPLALTRSLLAKAYAGGLRVGGQTQVTGVHEGSRSCLVQTDRGRVEAETVIIATGYEAHQLLGQSPGNLQSTYVVTSAPLKADSGWPEQCLLWETARPYFYARQTADGRAMIGGGDTAFANDHERDGLVERKVEKLQQRFSRLFPAIDFVPDYAWAGTFAETKDGLAFIGRVPGRSRIYCALGYGGNGITFSMIAARLLVDLYHGQENPDAEVFSFQR